jgi:hypothetical protein
MAVPNTVIFADNGTEKITYGDVRGYDDSTRLRALRMRLDYWLVAQIDPLAAKTNGELKVYCPFPLVILSCITIETLGAIFFSRPDEKLENKEVFERAAIYIDKRLKRPMQKGFFAKMKALFAQGKGPQPQSASDVLYKFFRNTMVHGYHARGVYMTVDIEPDAWRYDAGFLRLHPWNFWQLVRDGYAAMFNDVSVQGNLQMRQYALAYISILLA